MLILYIGAIGEDDAIATLDEVLIFFTGAEAIPPTGLPEKPTLKFDRSQIYPTASTCLLQMVLPTCHQQYATFKRHLNVAFKCHGGFGQT